VILEERLVVDCAIARGGEIQTARRKIRTRVKIRERLIFDKERVTAEIMGPPRQTCAKVGERYAASEDWFRFVERFLLVSVNFCEGFQ
jgi:hypothetical protein